MWEIAGDGLGMSKSDPGSILLGSRSECVMNPVTWNGRSFSGSLKHTLFYIIFPPMYLEILCLFLLLVSLLSPVGIYLLVRGDRFMDIESIQCIPEG